MRSLQLLILALLSLISAQADYQYFYPCDLRTIDCDAFPRHEYGDFGMSGDEANHYTGRRASRILLGQRDCEQCSR